MSFIKFANSNFATWFIPSILFTSIAFWYKECNNDTIKRDQAAQIVNEINTRIKFAKDRYTFCENYYSTEFVEGQRYDFNIDYSCIFSNLLTSSPRILNIDSIEYSPQFRNESLPNLINRLKLLDDRYDDEANKVSYIILKIKDYYKTHKYIDKGTYIFIKGYVMDSLTELKKRKN